ncbi:DUF3231 family protein [Priestia filamentosa]|uniref:DUF3231 family protein n=1 Tax=Priestia filamentosa TaxID=1402861 RepID=UPI0028958955|nr:DUF3231 family protein [Priestia filamentosa]MDT3762478.1 DUF3231 family protein [Priestia filamentosa]WRU96949.1 DUF3231 family protein [Priestia filamentosa]
MKKLTHISYIEKIQGICQEEEIPVPIGFTAEDVYKEAPKLYDNGFDIMFVRLIKEISMAMHTLNLTMLYRKDLREIFRELSIVTQKYFDFCTAYLIERGLIPKSPFVDPVKSIEFVKDASYLGILNPIKGKRSLNTVEMAHIYHAIESNMMGMQMIFGFAQCAETKEVGKFFSKGGELAKSMIKELRNFFLEDNIPVPGIAGGNVTISTIPPFSDKMMLYCVSLFCSFSLGGNSLGTAFSLRNDLPGKLSVFMKDIFQYAHEGAKIMIKHGWMEEPPQIMKK